MVKVLLRKSDLTNVTIPHRGLSDGRSEGVETVTVRPLTLGRIPKIALTLDPDQLNEAKRYRIVVRSMPAFGLANAAFGCLWIILDSVDRLPRPFFPWTVLWVLVALASVTTALLFGFKKPRFYPWTDRRGWIALRGIDPEVAEEIRAMNPPGSVEVAADVKSWKQW